MWKVPDFADEDKEGDKPSLLSAFTMRSVRRSLFVTLAFVLAHNILYTYIAPLLQFLGAVGQTDCVLLVFGLVALASIFIAGALIDKFFRPLILDAYHSWSDIFQIDVHRGAIKKSTLQMPTSWLRTP
ncbi:hypothetical protein LAV84_29255 [Rhizobium sp. VS19-DR104.2]|uniref:hypothetical protein n=1 Tax=unclassified Rhizobium TaxID=2613769 RepID=UPI001C5A99A2|nr:MULTISPECIES: hypothetical protein [unclassified Rhizobium]MBZ5805608.1 hypothetical protein [Rhizobium sp. VS19-DR181]MBZ5763568.1 hypothetical protein [Rhizobium sp. VS19-DR96]MBZ5769522.1 hypothetical protein [Rhizobium sp. VS19-DR129.2]MBZ5777053.1 hypothetical protein [Rhizobium sp. VS19-DRK62.2]MBZ5788153.1 hypothetical protein [Rhizobium sp. VS19-DR121]